MSVLHLRSWGSSRSFCGELGGNCEDLGCFCGCCACINGACPFARFVYTPAMVLNDARVCCLLQLFARWHFHGCNYGRQCPHDCVRAAPRKCRDRFPDFRRLQVRKICVVCGCDCGSGWRDLHFHALRREAAAPVWCGRPQVRACMVAPRSLLAGVVPDTQHCEDIVLTETTHAFSGTLLITSAFTGYLIRWLLE